MKIIYISNSIIPSKSANSIHVMKMCQAFADNGHEVILFAPNRCKEQLDNVNDLYEYYNVKSNFKIFFLKYSYIKYLGIVTYSLDVFNKLKNINPDLVYGRDLYSCFLSSFKYTTSFEGHAPMDNKIKSFLLNMMNRNDKYKKTIVISKVLKDIMLKVQKIDEKDLIIAHDGADEVLDFDSNVESITKANKLNIGYVGSLYKGKGVEVIINIASCLANMNFHIVGGKDEDIAYWKNKVNSDNIIFHGFISQKYLGKYMNSFDILLLPNQTNIYINNRINMNSNIGEYTSPLKMFEYMSAKKVIVSSNIPVLCEVLNRYNSVLVESSNYTEWIEALKSLENKNLRDKLSNQAYLDFIDKYTWKQRAKNIIRMFKSV